MTCTGCEKKLYRSIISLPAVSNVKTSLLLAQAEFDLRGSTSVNGKNIAGTIEKITGFSCAKIIERGETLDLTVDGSVENFTQNWPCGVSDLIVTGRRTIRVFYQPKIIGARDLLSKPFFHFTKLAAPAPPTLVASGRAHVLKTLRRTIIAALLTVPVLVLSWAPLPKHEILYGSIQLALATIVQTAIAGPFYASAIKTLLFSRMIEMDLLIVLSTTTAYVYSVVAYAFVVARNPLSTGGFFETSTLLVTFIMVGRTVSAYSRHKAIESISFESLQANIATIVSLENEDGEEIDARLLQYDDTLKVFPDMSVVTDGVVIAGESEVDESMITGESTLIAKGPGMSVIAGSVNHSGILWVKVTRLPCENTIKSIGTMVDEAKSSKPKIQEIADRIASYFVPAILGVTTIVFLVWVSVGKSIRHQSATVACINAMTYAISVLVVSCPCAIGLAVPMVVAIAGGVGVRRGLILKTSETIDVARKITHVIFDKTGTLTQGNLSVVSKWYLESAAESLPNMILGLTTNSKHPVSTAITAFVKDQGVSPLHVDNVVSIAGNGIEATCNGIPIRAGNPYWLGVQNSTAVQLACSRGLTIFCVSMDGELVAVFGLEDSIRPDALQTISQLKKRSVEISIISGDNEEAVRSVAAQLGVPASNVRYRCTPAEKQAYVKESLFPNNSIVLFCGDGTNDAVALAQASIGIHVNEGTDVAQSAADAVLTRPSLTGVITLMDLSKAFHRRVVFNFAWSFIYNVFAVLFAAGAFPRARLSPQFAGLGEVVSVLPVVAIAMHLKWTKL
jgi:heavy metal translocating P-type ATPase